MNKKPGSSKAAADKLVKNTRRKTRQTYSAEEKIRIVLAGLRGEESTAALCRRRASVIPPFSMGRFSRIQAAFLNFCIGVIPPMPMLGRSLL